MVRIGMDPFVREFQRDRYELWRAGLEAGAHPEDELSKLYPKVRQSAAAARAVCTPQQPSPADQTHKYAV